MLLLILANRHEIRLIQQNVTGHQAGVSKQTCVDVICILCRFVLELGHAAQFAEHGVAIQYPTKLRMLVHMGLNEQGVFLRVEAAGDVLCQLLQSTPAQISRILPHGNGMQVSHKVEAFILICTFCPILHRAQIRAQSQISGGLDAGEHSFLCNDFFHEIRLISIISCILSQRPQKFNHKLTLFPPACYNDQNAHRRHKICM